MKIKARQMTSILIALMTMQSYSQNAETPGKPEENVDKAKEAELPKAPADAPAPDLIPIPAPNEGGEALPPIMPVPKRADLPGQSGNAALDVPFTRNAELLPVPLTGITLFADTRKSTAEPAQRWEAGSKEQLKPGVQVVGGLSTPDPGGLRSQLQGFINRNKPASFRDVQDVVEVIQNHYRKHQRPMTHVYIPRQSMYSDKIVISILEGRVGEILILTEADLLKKDPAQLTSAEKGFLARMSEEKNFWDSWYDNPYEVKDVAKEFMPRTEVLKGRIVDLDEIKAQVNGMNRSPWARLNRPVTHPFRDVNVSFSQPAPNILGTTNLILEVDDRRPIRFFTGVDNTLTDITGENRFFLGGAWYDAFKLGKNHQLGAQLYSALDPGDLAGFALSYQVPWQNFKYDQFTEVFFSYAESSSTATLGGIPGVDIGGTSMIFGARHYIELPELLGATDMVQPLGNRNRFGWTQRSREAMGIHQEVGIGLDLKMIDNNLEFGGQTVADSPADVLQLVLEYNARQTDPTGETNLTSQLFISPGDITADNTDEAYNPLRADAEATYVYTRVRLDREQDLPFSGPFHGMMAKGAVTLQYGSTNLLANEQLGLGGYATVRGYPERALRGDIGAVMNLELYSPEYRPCRDWFKYAKDDQLRFLIFVDYAQGSSSSENPSDPLDDDATLMSVGAGLRYGFNDMFQLRLDYGVRLEDLPDAADNDDNGAFHFGAFCTF